MTIHSLLLFTNWELWRETKWWDLRFHTKWVPQVHSRLLNLLLSQWFINWSSSRSKVDPDWCQYLTIWTKGFLSKDLNDLIIRDIITCDQISDITTTSNVILIIRGEVATSFPIEVSVEEIDPRDGKAMTTLTAITIEITITTITLVSINLNEDTTETTGIREAKASWIRTAIGTRLVTTQTAAPTTMSSILVLILSQTSVKWTMISRLNRTETMSQMLRRTTKWVKVSTLVLSRRWPERRRDWHRVSH